MEIKLIATDLDGTFVDDEKCLIQENVDAFRLCAERGIQIVPATGRTMNGVPDEIKKLPGVRYMITTNGASVTNLETGEVISTCRMSAETAARVMKLARDSADDIMYDAYVEGIGYAREDFYNHLDHYVHSPALIELVRKTRKPVPDNIAYIESCGKDVEKINMFFVDMDARARMRTCLLEIPEIYVSSAIPNNLEINAVGADKGSALLRLAAFLHIKKEETMAFGDGENDISMIREAGLGVAMENGEENVKAVADYVTVTNNEAGVAAAIHKFIFGECVEEACSLV